MIDDEWTTNGALAPERLSQLRHTIENESAVIVEHRFYRGGRAPYRFVTDDFEVLEQYLRTSAIPGDAIYVWRFDDCCRDDNIALTGKIPDRTGRVPTGGAY